MSKHRSPLERSVLNPRKHGNREAARCPLSRPVPPEQTDKKSETCLLLATNCAIKGPGNRGKQDKDKQPRPVPTTQGGVATGAPSTGLRVARRPIRGPLMQAGGSRSCTEPGKARAMGHPTWTMQQRAGKD